MFFPFARSRPRRRRDTCGAGIDAIFDSADAKTLPHIWTVLCTTLIRLVVGEFGIAEFVEHQKGAGAGLSFTFHHNFDAEPKFGSSFARIADGVRCMGNGLAINSANRKKCSAVRATRRWDRKHALERHRTDAH